MANARNLLSAIVSAIAMETYVYNGSVAIATLVEAMEFGDVTVSWY
jgi:hypothetical protein